MPEIISLYCVFHLNIAFSSIDERHHQAVVRNCYWPLLKAVGEHGIPLGIELTGYTLETIQAISPDWVSKLKELLSRGKCELLASGDSQIIGPLIPAELNRKNLEVGQQTYQSLLDVIPDIAYVNEQAVSTGLLDLYLEAGFQAVMIEWDNPYSHNNEWSEELLFRPQTLQTAKGREIKVIWNNAVAFQKFQRFAHGEIVLDDYMSYLRGVTTNGCLAFCLYGSDAEVFDFRPVRFTTETAMNELEWDRIFKLFEEIKTKAIYQWRKPRDVLGYWQNNKALTITNAEYPISVKKQAKYNVTRWGLSGRNDLYLNSICYQRLKTLSGSHSNHHAWQDLCRLWSSDLRTHLTDSRYDRLASMLSKAAHDDRQLVTENEITTHPDFDIAFDSYRNRLHIRSKDLHLSLNTFRGLSIDSLAFASHDFSLVCGTLHHGYYKHIRYSADFYTNHLVMERFKQRDRVTDLKLTTYSLHDGVGALVINANIKTARGQLDKSYRIQGESIQCGFHFENQIRPVASLRLGFITLLDCSGRSWYACHNGGDDLEVFLSEVDYDHGSPVSSIVSSNCALGATTGEFYFGSIQKGVKLTWDHTRCAALPMVSSKKVNDEYLNRSWFSLVEADETLTEGGHLPSFAYGIAPAQLSELVTNK